MISEIFSIESFVWTCLWQSMTFVVVGLAASFFLRRRSSRAHQVLLLSIVAAVVVPVVSTLVKRYELGVFVAESAVTQSQLEDQAIASGHSPLGPIAQDFEYKPGLIEGDLQPVTTGPQSVKITGARIAIYGWIAASVILAIRLLVTFALGVRLLDRAELMNCKRMEQAVRSARTRLGINKNVEVCSSRAVRSPVIWCWMHRPVLLMPDAARQSDNGVDWTGVLCHELAHWKRQDHINGLLAEMAVCVLPWHLLLWWAKSRLISLSEQACDDWVVATGQPSTDYAESLLDLTPGGQMAFVPAVVRSKKGLAGRVRRILKDSCGNPRTGATWALAVSIAAACIAVGVAFAQERPAKAREAKDKNCFNGRFELSKDIAVELDAGPDGMRKIVHARSVRFDKTDSDIKVTLRTDVRKGLPFEWKTKIELLGNGDKVLGWRDSLDKARSLVSGQPVVEELVIEFSPFKQDEVANARRFRIRFEQVGPLLDELHRPYDANRTDWIQGRVTGPDGQPIFDAVVLINEHKPDGGPFRVPRVGTDEKGYYKFGAVDWPYRLGVERRQHLHSTSTNCYQLILLKRVLNGPQEVDFKFNEPAGGTASFVGRVVDTKRVPIREFKANIMEYNDLEEVDSEDIDGSYLESTWFNQEVNSEDGVFKLENIPAGKYRIRIIPKEKQYEWYRQEVVLADGKTTNSVLRVPLKHVLYGRVLFKDGSPAVLKPVPWPGAETRVLLPLGGRARRVATVEEDGYFAAYFDENSLEQLKLTGNSLIINVPTVQQGRRKTVGRFPFELLSTEKSKAGVIKVSRPETKPLVRDVGFGIGVLDTKLADAGEPITKEEIEKGRRSVAESEIERLGGSIVKVSENDVDYTEVSLNGPRYRRQWKGGNWGARYLNDLANIRKLRIQDVETFTNEGMEHLKRLRSLKSLMLIRTGVSDDGLVHLKDLVNLEFLSLSSNKFTDAGLEHITEMTELKSLRLDDAQITNEGLRRLKQCGLLTQLEFLTLNRTQITDAGLAYLQGMDRLRLLYLSETQIGDEGIAHLATLSKLDGIILNKTSITDAGLAHLKGLGNLNMLYLQNTQITNTGLEHIEELDNLVQLWVAGTRITDAGLTHIQGLTSLQSVNLERTRVTDKGLACLRPLTALSELFLQRSDVTIDGYLDLKGALPDCQIYWEKKKNNDSTSTEKTASADLGKVGGLVKDPQGRYKLESLHGVKHNVWAQADDLTVVALDSFEVKKGQTPERDFI